METSFAITGKGYVIVASDTTAARSIVKMKTDDDKIKVVSPHLLMSYSGEPGDTIQFAEYVERNLPLLHYLGTMTEVPFGAHGYGSYFALSLLDRYHDPEATLEEGLATLKRCIDEVAKRLVVSPGKYKIKVVDKDVSIASLLQRSTILNFLVLITFEDHRIIGLLHTRLSHILPFMEQ
ncbi:20S proteasome subunit [Lentinula edodes]|uniref:20S proteasome subunit n=1 Tax=Lentinula edodes TaxID=5353 RepID=A0A1Q3ETP9_LENED|nr:20S proteasome subunit [Lentinula edodes]